MDLKITNEQKIHVRLNPVTAHGNPASIDGSATFEVLSGDATVVMDEDGLGAFLVSGDLVLDNQIAVSADAQLGEGVVTLTDTIILSVVAPNASALGITSDAAEDK